MMSDTIESLERGLAAFKSGDYDTAILALEEATRLDSSNYLAFSYLGAAYAGKKKFNAAIGAFKMAEQLSPGTVSIHFNLGQAYEAAGVPEEAEYQYEYALRINPAYSRAQDALDALRRRREQESSSSE
jgi:tetratricopeptide (TPR) repeat protein